MVAIVDVERERFARRLRRDFALEPEELTDEELEQVIGSAIVLKRGQNRPLNAADWERVVRVFCPTVGSPRFDAIDTTELDQILDRLSKPKP